jgi:hypothetical protein
MPFRFLLSLSLLSPPPRLKVPHPLKSWLLSSPCLKWMEI